MYARENDDNSGRPPYANLELMEWYEERRSGSAVECRTLDRENPVTNPLHMMATRCGGVTPRQKQNPCNEL